MFWVKAGNRLGSQIKNWMTSGGHPLAVREQIETRKMAAGNEESVRVSLDFHLDVGKRMSDESFDGHYYGLEL